MKVYRPDYLASQDRLEALKNLHLLDTPAEPAFDRLTSLATRILKVPTALVSLVTAERQFFKSCVGLPEPWASLRETPLSHSFCQHVVTSGEPLVIEDARLSPLLQENLAIRDLKVIAYAGIPLKTAEGQVLGSFCVIDSQPRDWSMDEINLLRDLALSVMTEIELRAQSLDYQRLQTSLVQERNLLRTVIDTLPDFVYAKDTQSRYMLNNLNHAHSMGVTTPDLILGKTDFDYFPQAMAERFFADEQKLFATGRPLVQREEPSLGIDGSLIWASTTKVPLVDNSGNIIGLVGVTRDITERKEAEERRFELERQRDRTQTLKRFISDVSHDLRTPLSIMMTKSYLLRRVTDPLKREGYLDNLEEQTTHMTQVLDDMSNLVRLETDEIPLRLESCDLKALVSEVCESLQSGLTRKRQQLNLDLNGDLPPLVGDRSELRLALRHLIVNAINYTAEGGMITVSTGLSRQQGIIAINDNGIGISPEDLPHIFERFYRADKARSIVTGGTGIGLAIAKKIIEAHQGSIQVESTVGAGSLFRVRLPLIIEQHDKG